MLGIMSHEILPFLLALTIALSWAICIPLLLARWSGIDLPLNPFKRRRVKTSIERYITEVGVLTFGVGMLIFDLCDRYIRWKMFGGPSDRLTPEQIVGSVLGCLIAGV